MTAWTEYDHEFPPQELKLTSANYYAVNLWTTLITYFWTESAFNASLQE